MSPPSTVRGVAWRMVWPRRKSSKKLPALVLVIELSLKQGTRPPPYNASCRFHEAVRSCGLARVRTRDAYVGQLIRQEHKKDSMPKYGTHRADALVRPMPF